MSVEISPSNQLGFPRPLTQLVKRSILIHNPHPHPVAFKVKTTAPKQYCVRPNSGRVESGENVKVEVLLQPLTTEPPPHAKCKDKFLVQSAYISPDEEMRTLAEMWSQTEKTNKSAIQEHKLRVVYLAAEDGAAANGIPEENEDAGEQSRIDESAIFAPATSSPTAAINGNDIASPTSPPAQPVSASAGAAPVTAREEPPSTSTVNEPKLPSLTAADIEKTGTGVSPTNASLEQSLSATTSDSEKLQLALKEIERLRADLDEARGPQATGLRKRGGAGAGASTGTGAEIAVEKAKEVVQGNQGVPIEVVAGLVVAVFVMTYMFF